MSPGQHFIISWVVANSVELDRRSRICITASGLLPDLDGIGVIADKIGPYFDYHTTLYAQYHHVFGHNLLSGFLLSLGFAHLCQKKLIVFFLCLLAFHLHLLGDLVGSMGPDGNQWPIYYLYPFIPSFELTWSGQWELSSWRNSAIGIFFFCIALVLARHRQVTFFELISIKIENAVAEVAKQRGIFKQKEIHD